MPLKSGFSRLFIIMVLLVVALAQSARAQDDAPAQEEHSLQNRNEHYSVQVCATHDQKAAAAFADTLVEKGYDAFIVTVPSDNSTTLYKIRFGSFATVLPARRAAQRFEQQESTPGFVVPTAREAVAATTQRARPPAHIRKHANPRPSTRSFNNFLNIYFSENPVESLLGRTSLQIEPSFAYRLEYEDNVDGSRHDKIEDFSNHYAPEIAIIVQTPRVSLTAAVKLDIVEYESEKDWNYVDQEYLLTLGFQLSERFLPYFSFGYTIISDQDRYLAEDDAFSSTSEYIVKRTKNKTKQFGVGFQYAATPRSIVNFSGYLSQFETGVTNDTDFILALLNYSYALTPRTKLLLNTQFQYFDFAFSGSGGDTNFLEDLVVGDAYDLFFDSDYQMKTYNISLGGEHVFSDAFSIKLNAGYRYSETESSNTRTDPDTGAQITVTDAGDGDGGVFSLELLKRFGDLSFTFQANHNIGNNPSTGGSYEQTRLYLKTAYDITRRLKASLLLRYSLQQSDAGDAEFGRDLERNIYYISSRVDYKLNRWLTVALSHSYRLTDNEGNKNKGNTFYINLRFTPLRPLVMR